MRPAIPGSDVKVLVTDFGLPILAILLRKAVLRFTALLILIAASLTVLPALSG